MTSTLQQSASNLLGFSPKKTMTIAQSLYEGVKTDSGIGYVPQTNTLTVTKVRITIPNKTCIK